MGNQISATQNEIDSQLNEKFPTVLSNPLPLNLNEIPSTNSNLELHFVENTSGKDFDAESISKELSLTNQTLEVNPNNEVLWLLKAKLHMRLGKYNEAIKFIDVAISKNPTFVASYYMKIKCFYHLGDITNAIKVFDKLLMNNTNNYSILLNKALFYDDIKYNTEAIKIYDNLIEIDSSNPVAFYCKGNSLIELNELKSAIDCFDECIKIDKNNLNALLRKAVISQQLNREDDAKKLAERIEKTIALNENDNNKHYDIKKIKEYLNMIKLMNKLIEEEKSDKEDIDIKFKIYNGSISNFYEGEYRDKKIGVNIFKTDTIDEDTINIIKKQCLLFSYTNARKSNVIEVIKTQYIKTQNELRIGVEYCQCGNLSNYLFKDYSKIRITERISFIKQICQAVLFMLNNNIDIFNINTRKLLLTKSHDIRLSDIGIKHFFSHCEVDYQKLYKEIYDVIIEVIKIPGCNVDLDTLNGIVKHTPQSLIDVMKSVRDEKGIIDKEEIIKFVNLIYSIDIS